MKNLKRLNLIVFTAILYFSISLLTSCSKEDIQAEASCNCIEETYVNETYVCYGSTGLPMLCFEAVVISSRGVDCQEEFDNQEQADGSIIRVVCNE